MKPEEFPKKKSGRKSKKKIDEKNGKSDEKKLTRKEIFHLASLDYIRGISLREIAEQYKIPFDSVKRWHWEGNWAKLRKEYQKKYAKTIFDRFSENVEASTDWNLKAAKLIAEACYKKIEAEIFDKKGNFRGKKKVDDFIKIFRMAQLSAGLPSLAMPTLPTDLAERILTELKELKEINQNRLDGDEENGKDKFIDDEQNHDTETGNDTEE